MTSPHSSTDEKKAHYDTAATDAEVAVGQVNDYDEGEVFRKVSHHIRPCQMPSFHSDEWKFRMQMSTSELSAGHEPLSSF